jgi:hypothetical protein
VSCKSFVGQVMLLYVFSWWGNISVTFLRVRQYKRQSQ